VAGRKKLIEVALPLEAINRESAREKSIRHGHPSTLHLWWARRPLAACRAVLFASIVDDPSSKPEEFPTEEAQDAERQRLFRILEELEQRAGARAGPRGNPQGHRRQPTPGARSLLRRRLDSA
jgi:adenine-specific DNA methylase